MKTDENREKLVFNGEKHMFVTWCLLFIFPPCLFYARICLLPLLREHIIIIVLLNIRHQRNKTRLFIAITYYILPLFGLLNAIILRFFFIFIGYLESPVLNNTFQTTPLNIENGEMPFLNNIWSLPYTHIRNVLKWAHTKHYYHINNTHLRLYY